MFQSSPHLPSVGVIIANRNHGSFVGQAIASAAAQTVRDLRIVVVDDASTDNSDAVIRATMDRLNDPRISHVRLTEQVGQAGAIRRGLSDLESPFVCFLDADDYWYSNFVAQHLSAHLNTDYPVALSFCDSHIVDAASKLLAGTAWWFDHEDHPGPISRRLDPASLPTLSPQSDHAAYPSSGQVDLRIGWSKDIATNTMSSMMMRRSFVDLVFTDQNNVDATLRLYVDYYLATMAALLTGTLALNDRLYAYRMHGANHHSNGNVLGGAYNSSRIPWSDVRDSVLQLIARLLDEQAAAITEAFGPHRYGWARSALHGALNPPRDGANKFVRWLAPWK